MQACDRWLSLAGLSSGQPPCQCCSFTFTFPWLVPPYIPSLRLTLPHFLLPLSITPEQMFTRCPRTSAVIQIGLCSLCICVCGCVSACAFVLFGKQKPDSLYYQWSITKSIYKQAYLLTGTPLAQERLTPTAVNSWHAKKKKGEKKLPSLSYFADKKR